MSDEESEGSVQGSENEEEITDLSNRWDSFHFSLHQREWYLNMHKFSFAQVDYWSSFFNQQDSTPCCFCNNLLILAMKNLLYFISDVCTKYQEASKIVNLALTGLVSQCLTGATIIELCKVRYRNIMSWLTLLCTQVSNDWNVLKLKLTLSSPFHLLVWNNSYWDSN